MTVVVIAEDARSAGEVAEVPRRELPTTDLAATSMSGASTAKTLWSNSAQRQRRGGAALAGGSAGCGEAGSGPGAVAADMSAAAPPCSALPGPAGDVVAASAAGSVRGRLASQALPRARTRPPRPDTWRGAPRPPW